MATAEPLEASDRAALRLAGLACLAEVALLAADSTAPWLVLGGASVLAPAGIVPALRIDSGTTVTASARLGEKALGGDAGLLTAVRLCGRHPSASDLDGRAVA